MSIDIFFSRQYDEKKYNCAHFVAEVWQHLTGRDIQEPLGGFLLPPGKRSVPPRIRHRFKRLDKPQSPCIVLLHGSKGSAHVGVFLNGRVLHIQENGVQFQPLNIAALGFRSYRFYYA